MYACKGKKEFFGGMIAEQQKVLHRPDYNEASLMEDGAIIYYELATLGTHIWTFFAQNGIEKVP